MSKYLREIRTEQVDVYDVLEAWDVRCPALQHAIKKLLMPGARGAKDTLEDLLEGSQSLSRAIELQKEREFFDK